MMGTCYFTSYITVIKNIIVDMNTCIGITSSYPLDASLVEVVDEGAEVTTVMPWKAGWSTNEAFAGREELLLVSC